MIKYYYCFLMMFVLSACSFGQPNQPLEIDKRLYDIYDDAFIDRMKSDNPFLIKRLNFYLDHSFIITDLANAKENDYPEVVINDLENVNILFIEKEQKLKHDFHKKVIYKIANTNKMLVYYSGKEFNEKLREFLQKNK